MDIIQTSDKTKMTYMASVKMDKKQARELHKMLNPPTRPTHISPKKKVSWRLIKKWFNRHEKSEWLKRCVRAVSIDGKTQLYARITGVKICKTGGHTRDYSFTASPETINKIES